MAGNDHSRPPFTLSRRDVLAGTLAAPVFGRPFSVTADDRVMLGAGPNGLAVPKMGVGCWAWGDKTGVWGYGGYDKSLSDETIAEAFKASIDKGVNFFDTAEVYGNGVSEEILGRLIKGLPAAQREKVTVATKFYPVDPGNNLPRLSLPKDLLSALDNSLTRLQMPSVDLYQIHAPLLPESPESVADALAEAVKSGRAKSVGVSNYALAEMLPIYNRLDKQHGIKLASNQVELSLLRQLPVTGGLLRESRKLGVGILAYSPLAMGRLTGKYGKGNKPSGSRFFGKAKPEQLEPLLASMAQIAEARGKTVAQVALNWVVCQGAVPIPGAKNAKQAADNAGALGWELTEEELRALAGLGKEGKTNPWQHDGKV